MKIKDLMTRDVKAVVPESTLQEAAHIMKSLDIGFLPVCTSEKIEGVLTDRDIVVRAVVKGLNPKKVMVKDIMTKGVEWVEEEEDVVDVVKKMTDSQIRRIPVINRKKDLVGIVSLGDLSVRADEEEAETALHEISKPVKKRRF